MAESADEVQRQQLSKFLKDNSILKVMDPSVIYGLSMSLREMTMGPGAVVFKEGDKSDGLYIIKKGNVEVRSASSNQPIAYLTAGECFGEMALTKGGTRSATVRVPEEAVLLKLPQHASLDLINKFPAMAKELEKLAKERSAAKPAFKAPGLQGNTAFFDLPTLIQAVAGSKQSGLLNIFGTGGSTGGKLGFTKGQLISANFEHLAGDMAVYELLSLSEPANFAFDRRDDAQMAAKPHNITAGRPLEVLLLEGSRRMDESVKLQEQVGDREMSFVLDKSKEDLQKVAKQLPAQCVKIWSLVELGLTIDEMFLLLDVDRYAILQGLADLLSHKLIKPSGKSKKAKIARPVAALTGVSMTEDARRAQAEATAELDVNQVLEGPARVAQALYALNMVSSNLASVLEPSIVRDSLKQALSEAQDSCPQLKCLHVHRGGKTIDVRSATPELCGRYDSRQALTLVARRFVELVAVAVK